MTPRILFVDDDPHLLASFQRNLRKQFTLDVAAGAREALELIVQQGPYAAVVADMRMPGMDGLRLLEHLGQLSPDTVRIMLTGNADQPTTMQAINRAHVFRFLSKPCPPEVLVPVLQAAVDEYTRVRAERAVLESTLTHSINALVEVLGMTVPEAHERGQVLCGLLRDFAGAVGVAASWELEIAARLSAIGFAALPPDVLRKVTSRVPLLPREAAMVRRVPKVGHDLLHQIPRLENVARIILYQDKNFDGSGQPDDSCQGEGIPFGARMLKILRDRLEVEEDGKIGPTAFALMKERFGIYDFRLLETCFVRFPAMLRARFEGERAPLALSITELRPGQRLQANVVTSNGLVLAAAGYGLTAMLIERLRNQIELCEVREPFLICNEQTEEAVPSSHLSADEGSARATSGGQSPDLA